MPHYTTLFNTVVPWTILFWVFFRAHLFDRESDYILVADETVTTKSCKNTYGLSRFFSSIHGKTVPGLLFLAMSIVGVTERRSYPMAIEQIVRGDISSAPATSEPKQQDTRDYTLRRKGRPCIYGDRFNSRQIASKYCVSVNIQGNLRTEFMVNVSAKLIDTHNCKNTAYSVLDLKAHYRGLKYMIETLKILPQKPEPIVIQQINGYLGSIGVIHYTQPELKQG